MRSKALNLRILKQLLFYLVAVAAYFFTVKRLVAFGHWNDIGRSLYFSCYHIVWLLIFFLLWVANMFFEIKKWQLLISPFKKITLRQSLIQYLAGCFTAVGSPGRVAEPGGRMVLLDRHLRVNALLMTTAGGIMQNVVIMLAGLVVILITGLPESLSVIQNKQLDIIVALLCFCIVFVLLLSVFKIKLRSIWLQCKEAKGRFLLKVFVLTFIRYVVYTIQLYVLFQLLNVHLSFSNYLLLSPLYFLTITVIPSFLLADVGIRGSAALLVFRHSDIQTPVLLFCILCLWLFNVVLPALVGGWVIYRQKVYKRSES